MSLLAHELTHDPEAARWGQHIGLGAGLCLVQELCQAPQPDASSVAQVAGAGLLLTSQRDAVHIRPVSLAIFQHTGDSVGQA